MRLAGLAALLSLAACVPSADARDPSLLPIDDWDPHTPVDVQALAREVAADRHLALRRPIRAHALNEASFRDRLFLIRSRTSAAGASHPAFWTTFGGAAPSSVAATARRVLEEDVAGFYDPADKALFVRGRPGDSDHILLRRRQDLYTLAHEIEHALQDQNFGLELHRPDDDAWLAYKALVEGDAVLTALAVRAARTPGSDHWVSRITMKLRSKTEEELVRQAGLRGGELASAPSLLRRRLLFPYLEGMAFAGDLYRAGGLELVDRAFGNPPVSTEQVLHPDKYLAGELPVPVTPPAPPDGWTPLTSGRMGELQTSALLAQCLPAGRASEAATGWGGDAYTLARAADGSTAILWSTAWDDEASAARFEGALRAQSECLRERDPGHAPSAVVLRDGAHVAYVQGVDGDAGRAIAQTLLTLPGARPANAPPFGAVSIPPLVDPDTFAHDGRYDDRRWRSRSLGISMAVPDGFDPVEGARGFEALMRHEATHSLAGFAVLMDRPTAPLERAYVHGVLASLRASHALGWQRLDYAGEDELAVGDRVAHTYEWHPAYGGHILIGFVPACEGHATVALYLMWSDAAGRAMNRWLDVFRLPDDHSPTCAYLERTTD